MYVASSHYRVAGLPKLRTTPKGLCRRDSLSSSRTHDSGYISDQDAPGSPLDGGMPWDQYARLTSFPSVPTTTWRNDYSQPTPLVNLAGVTSNPTGLGIASQEKLEALTANKPRPNIDTSSRPHSTICPAIQEEDIENWIAENLPYRNRPKERLSSITSLSSTSSCSMHSHTDTSDDDCEGDMQNTPALPRSTVKTIDMIMRKIEVNLRYATYMQCVGSSSSSGSINYTTNSGAQQNNRKASQGNSKRKARTDENLPPDDADEDGPNKRRRGSVMTIDSSDTGVRFACPFYKHDPSRYRNRRTCPGPGWPTVHRVKEHLYRSHSQASYCPRCYSMFDSDSDLSQHLRSQHCEVSAPQPIEGVDRETMMALRKRSPALRLEEDKWRDAYQLLFPHVSFEDIPSPFYSNDAPDEESRRFRRELLRRVQEELFATAERTPVSIEQQLLRQVANIVRRCERDILDSGSYNSNTVPALTDRRTSTTSTLSTASIQAMVIDLTIDPATASEAPAPTLHTNIQSGAFEIEPENQSELTIWKPLQDQTSTVPEQSVQFRQVPWGSAAAQTSSNAWIDWDSIFPSMAGDDYFETLHSFQMPNWT